MDHSADFQTMLDALIEIAAYDDHGANETLKRHGSYSSFDEPGSVKTARDALSKIRTLAIHSKDRAAVYG